MKTLFFLILFVGGGLFGNERAMEKVPFLCEEKQIEAAFEIKGDLPPSYFLYLFDMSFTMSASWGDLEDAVDIMPMFTDFFNDQQSPIRSECLVNGWGGQEVDDSIQNTNHSAAVFQQVQDLPSLAQFTVYLSQLTQYANFSPSCYEWELKDRRSWTELLKRLSKVPKIGSGQ